MKRFAFVACPILFTVAALVACEAEKPSETPKLGCGLDGHSCGNGYCCGTEEMCGDGKNGCAENSCCFIGPSNARPGPQHNVMPPSRHR